MDNDTQRYNMFYKTDIYPQMATVNGNYNRSLHSESYANSNNSGNKMNIVENRMATTMMLNQPRHHLSGSNKRNRLKLMKPQNIRNYFSNQGEQLYVKVGEINQVGPHSSSSQQSHTPQSQNGSVNWSQQNFNIYENQLHNVQRDDSESAAVYNGNQSIMSYMSSKDFPENV